MTGDKKVKKIRANKELQAKVGMGKINEKEVAAAQKVIDENKVEFAPLAKPHIGELARAINKALKDGGSDDEILQSFRSPIMNLKANAATFNYPVVSGLSGTVLAFLESVPSAEKKVIQIVDILYKTVLLVIAKEMSGDGGSEGKALQLAFQELCDHYLKKIS